MCVKITWSKAEARQADKVTYEKGSPRNKAIVVKLDIGRIQLLGYKKWKDEFKD